jgi:hypothetical protein
MPNLLSCSGQDGPRAGRGPAVEREVEEEEPASEEEVEEARRTGRYRAGSEQALQGALEHAQRLSRSRTMC